MFFVYLMWWIFGFFTHSFCVCLISVLLMYFMFYSCFNFMYSRSHLGWNFWMLFQSAKLKARMPPLPRFSEKRRSSFELWALKELSKMSPQVGSAVLCINDCKHWTVCVIHIIFGNSLPKKAHQYEWTHMCVFWF